MTKRDWWTRYHHNNILFFGIVSTIFGIYFLQDSFAIKSKLVALKGTIRTADTYITTVTDRRGHVKDFYTNSLHKGVNGVVLTKSKYQTIAGIKLDPAQMRETVAHIEGVYKKRFPESVFEFEFLDDMIANFYKEEVKMFKLFRVFAGISIFISCLGLYGLISFMAVQRTKEIGIRKVLGASLGNIVSLFTKEFFFLIIIAFGVAAPISAYLMNSWLQNFENRLPLGISSFLIAIAFSLVIAGITITYRAIVAALINPVESLKNE